MFRIIRFTGGLVLITSSLVGTSTSALAQTDALRCYGQEDWIGLWDGPDGLDDRPWALAMAPDGSRVYVTGYNMHLSEGCCYNYATVAYDTGGGGEAWVAHYDGPGGSNDHAFALGVSPDGGAVYVTGLSRTGTYIDSSDYGTVGYDADTGEELWATLYNGPGGNYDKANALGVSPDGSIVFVTGESRFSSTSSDWDFATVAYDANDGEELWVTRYDGPGNDEDKANALVVSPDGSTVFVAGWSMGNGTSLDYAMVAYDATTGEELWAARYNGPGNDEDRVGDPLQGKALSISPDGATVFVTGESRSGVLLGSADYATVAYDAVTGDELWVARYNGSGDGHDAARDLDVSPDGDVVFVTGRSLGDETVTDYATVAYNAATGEELWVSRYDMAYGTEEPEGLVVSPDGSTVYVTGGSLGSTTDYATVAYDATTGEELGVVRFDGIDSADRVYGLGISPDGSEIYVTGYSISNLNPPTGTGYDYATMAYDAESFISCLENDDTPNAIVLTESGSVEGSNFGATLEENEPEVSCPWGSWSTNYSVWWSFIPEVDGEATISLEGSDFNTILSLHDASDLSEVACNDDVDFDGGLYWSLLEDVPVSQGESYLIRVAGHNESNSNMGDIQLEIDAPFTIADEATPEEIAEGLSVPSPNPARETTTFTIAVERSQDVTVEALDVTGRRVQTLYTGTLASGVSEALTLDTSVLPAGVYLIRATGEDFTETQHLTVVH